MTDTVTVGRELEGQILDTVRKSQGMAFEAIQGPDRRDPASDNGDPGRDPAAGLRLRREADGQPAEVRRGRAAPDSTAHPGPGQEGLAHPQR